MTLAGFLIFLTLLGRSHAEQTQPPLSWTDCVAIAAKNNPDLTSSSYSLEAGRSSYYGSYNGFLPSVSLSNSYSDNEDFASDSYHWQAQGSVNLNVWNMGQVAAI